MIKYITLILLLFIIKTTESSCSYKNSVGYDANECNKMKQCQRYPVCCENSSGYDRNACNRFLNEERENRKERERKVWNITLTCFGIFFIITQIVGNHWWGINWCFTWFNCCYMKTEELLNIEAKQPKTVVDEWVEFRKKLHDYPAIEKGKVCYAYPFICVFFPLWLLACCLNRSENKKKREFENKLQGQLYSTRVGSWEQHENKNSRIAGGEEVMLVNIDKSNQIMSIDVGLGKTLKLKIKQDPIQCLQRIVERNRYSAFTYYPKTNHAVLRKFKNKINSWQLNSAYGYNCTTYLFTSPEQIAEVKLQEETKLRQKKEAKQKELADKFMNATKSDKDAANYYLEVAGNDLQTALTNFFNGPDETKVDKFIDVTQSDRATARLYLEAARNDLNEAMKNYYSTGGQMSMPVPIVPAPPVHMFRPSSPTPSCLSVNITINNDNKNIN